jgi:hypothetical protein
MLLFVVTLEYYLHSNPSLIGPGTREKGRTENQFCFTGILAHPSCIKLNVDVPRELAVLAKNLNFTLIYISTGSRANIEFDQP